MDEHRGMIRHMKESHGAQPGLGQYNWIVNFHSRFMHLGVHPTNINMRTFLLPIAHNTQWFWWVACNITARHIAYYIGSRSITQLPQSVGPIFHNAPLCYRNVHTCEHFCYNVVCCGIFDASWDLWDGLFRMKFIYLNCDSHIFNYISKNRLGW